MQAKPKLAQPVTAAVSGTSTAVVAALAGVVDTPVAAAVTFLVVVAATYVGFAVGRIASGEAVDASTSNGYHVGLAVLLAVAIVVARIGRGSTGADPVSIGTTVVVTATGAFAVLKLADGCRTAYRTLTT